MGAEEELSQEGGEKMGRLNKRQLVSQSTRLYIISDVYSHTQMFACK
jgi:hypothetical protein